METFREKAVFRVQLILLKTISQQRKAVSKIESTLFSKLYSNEIICFRVNFKKNEKTYSSNNSEVLKAVQESDNEPRDSEPGIYLPFLFASTHLPKKCFI